MAIEWDTYEAILHRDGETYRDRAINREREMLMRRMTDSPASKTVLVNGEEKDLLMLSTDAQDVKNFKMLPGDTIEVGDMVEWNNEHWIVIRVDFDDEITRNGRIKQCNHLFRWQNGTPDIIYRWGVLDPGVYSTTLDEEEKVVVPDKQYKIYLPFDEDTKKLYLHKKIATEIAYDKDGKEVLVVYELTGRDSITSSYGVNGHLLVMYARSGGNWNPINDNLELMICDYIAPEDEPVPPSPPDPVDPPDPPIPPISLLPCSISGRETLKAGLGARKYVVTFYEEDGETENSSVTAFWTVVLPAGHESYIHYTINDNTLSLSADEDAVGEMVILQASDTDGLYQPCEFTVKVVGSL